MVQASMQYTMGTALSRAHEGRHLVDILVENHWMSGRVVALDGMGVVLAEGQDHCVVRVERISAVRVREGTHVGITPEEEREPDGARPMPGPDYDSAETVAAVVAEWA